MSIFGFLIAILAGTMAAGIALWGGAGLLMAALAYSLGGATAFVLTVTVAGFFLPARASPAGTDLP